jgi:RES domain-containing protein
VNISRCSSLAQTRLRGTWYRAADPRFLATALSTLHTATTPSRFSPARAATPAFEILYLAENPMVALFEARALFGSPSTPGGVVPHPTRPLVTLPNLVSLGAISDLTDPAEATVIDTSAQELTGDWRSYATRIPPAGLPAPHTGTPPTQLLGSALFALASLQGLVRFSATLPDYKILVVFPDRLKGTPDHLQYSYHDARGAIQVMRIP